MTADPILFQACLWLLVHVLCLLVSFLFHELAHVLGMMAFRGVSDVVISASTFRFSLIPLGKLDGWKIGVIAVLGPGSSCAVGAAIALLSPDSFLQYWFLLHGIFLLPFFGDGRSLLVGLRNRSGLVSLTGPSADS
ncbi:hypothetical protein [Arthrobacter sp. AZCC_0090]|uniref:hypothetical protein n=1 Tax=Arthrobacter sp. AZCC_0090 TaxID=2735881 RepID=UPI00161AD1B4|nr:hypothetical protein [Arthrobacter sp. AZCC_0090]MBB6403728.1 hypothetical protein [Arthrobacter sp. AZCC_0090]